MPQSLTFHSTRSTLGQGDPRRRSASHIQCPIVRRSLRDTLALAARNRLGKETVLDGDERSCITDGSTDGSFETNIILLMARKKELYKICGRMNLEKMNLTGGQCQL